MKEYEGFSGSLGFPSLGDKGCRGLGLRSVLAFTVLLLAGCAPEPAPQIPTPPLVIFFVDGVRLSQAAADSIWQVTDRLGDADSVRVLKDPQALAEYGAEGRPGVVLVYLKKEQKRDGVALR